MKPLTSLIALAMAAFLSASVTVSQIKAADDAANKGDLVTAVKLYRELANQSPTQGEYWGILGRCEFGLKRYKECAEDIEKSNALGYFPQSGEYLIARAFAAAGDIPASVKALEKALKAGYYGADAPGGEKEFEALKGNAKFAELTGRGLPPLSRDAEWVTDVDFMVKEARRMHVSFDRIAGKRAVDDVARRLKSDVPHLKDHEIVVRMMEIMALAGDGHTFVRPAADGKLAFHVYPIQLFQFEEGFYVTAAADPKLLGAHLISIGGKPVEKAVEMVKPTISGETPQTILAREPRSLTTPEILNACKVVPDMDNAEYGFEKDGQTFKAILKPAVINDPAVKMLPFVDPKDAPMYLKRRAETYWFEYLPETKMVFFQYNAVRDSPTGENFADFCARMFKFIDDNPVERMVIDIRANGGGNLFLNEPLIHGLIACKKLDETGRLFTIIGRQTYSAAMSLTGNLDRHTQTLFVGEPTGSSPNFIGENGGGMLPYSKLKLSVSSLYWQNTNAMDHRIWIAPQIAAPPSWKMYAAKRDPAMEGILAAIAGP